MQLIIKILSLVSTTLILTLYTFSSCTSKESKSTQARPTNTSEASAKTETSKGTFPLPTVPVIMTNPEDIMMYLSEHYWDLYDFSDISLIAQADITEQGLANYIQLLNQLSFTDAEKSINTMLNKAKPHPAMYRHFASLYEFYLYEPNSPFRNDELYIPVVKHLSKSGVLSQDKQELYAFHLTMVQKNRVATTASNFAYTLANGDKKMMHNLQSNYLILFFTNPDCPGCASTTDQIVNSLPLQDIFSLNTSTNKQLTVLSIYPDANIDEWRKALPSLPQQHWVNGYDDGEVIYNNLVYDIKAIPTLYLLDKDKKVILKDVSLGEIEEYFMELSKE